MPEVGCILSLQAIEADITGLAVDAIVNAANESLRGGGGVDGAIHRAAGPLLLQECIKIGGCPTGGARITGGYDLPARFVIHTVGPIWQGGENNEDSLLAGCYHSSLILAQKADMESIAFPCISTGVYGFPFERACDIAIRSTVEFLQDSDASIRVTFCCFSAQECETYQVALQARS